MKVKWSGLVVEGRGKLGGTVASRNKGGAYFRNRVKPTNPQTSAQMAVRASLAEHASAWRGLTQAQRDSFISLASDTNIKDSLGEDIKPSGINIFTRLNQNLSIINQTSITSAPAQIAVAGNTITTIVATKGTDALSLSFANASEVGKSTVIRATKGVSAGKTFVKSEYRIIEVINGAITDPVNILASYEDKFGEMPEVGQKIFFEVYVVDNATGFFSQRSSESTIVVAST